MLNSNDASMVHYSQTLKTNHELALELAKMYIQMNSDKYKSNFVTMCTDFYLKYTEAIKVIETTKRN